MNPKTKVGNALTVTQSDEETIFTVKRHPIGLVGPYALCGALTIATAVIAFIAAPNSSDGTTNTSTAAGLAMAVFLIVALLCAGFAFLVTKVYLNNQWVLTSDSLTQVAQNSLFDRESSQLSLHNLEDISAEQNGIFPHMFNYGLIKVETAGEKSKFIFNYCPNPNFYAQKVLAAREAFLKENPTLKTNDLPKKKLAKANFLDPATVEYDPPAKI